MKIASAAGVLGEKIKVDSTFNSLVNDQGNFFIPKKLGGALKITIYRFGQYKC
jgi:hypothetical protein